MPFDTDWRTLNSYLIHVDPVDSGRQFRASIEIPNPIAAVISSTSTLNQTDDALSAEGVTYPDASARGLEYGRNAIALNRSTNKVKLDVRTGGVVEQIRILTLADSTSDLDNDVDNPRSCSTLAKNGETNDGVYTIDPDGAGGTPPFDTYCVFGDNGDGWIMVSKIATRETKDAGCSWALGPLNGETGSGNLEPSIKATHVNRYVHNYWNQNGFSVDEVGVDLYKDGESVK